MEQKVRVGNIEVRGQPILLPGGATVGSEFRVVGVLRVTGISEAAVDATGWGAEDIEQLPGEWRTKAALHSLQLDRRA